MVDEQTSAKVNGFGKGLIIGGLVGAAVALLYAPQTGAQLRKDVRKKANGLRMDFDRYAHKVKKQTNGILGKVRETTNNVARNRQVHA